MKMNNNCCGSGLSKKPSAQKTTLPPNPMIQSGIAVIYLGSGDFSLKGSGTGFVYYASDHYRHFRIHEEDIRSVLQNPNIILKP